MKVTIKDIAAKLGLDVSTVSYALSGKGTIKPETREWIRRTAEELGYVPNGHARKVRTGRSNLVGIIMPNVLFGHGEYVQHSFRLLSDAGFESTFALTEFSERREESAVRTMLENCVSGILIKTLYGDFDKIPKGHPLRIAASNGLPLMTLGGAMRNSPFGALDFNLFEVGRLLGSHLAETGRRTVRLLISHPPPFHGNVDGVMGGLKEGGGGRLEVSPEWVDCGKEPGHLRPGSGINVLYEHEMKEMLYDSGVRAGKELMGKMLSAGELPDAAVCLHDNCAAGVLCEAHRRGVEIPGRMALASCVRLQTPDFDGVTITSAYPSPESAAEISSSLLLDMIKGKEKEPRTVKLAPELHMGNSTLPGREARRLA